jgi:phage regulator Rha-like protein
MEHQLALNSLDLAAQMSEPHHEVLRCIDGLIADGMESSRFREAYYVDNMGVKRRCVDMTKEAAMRVATRLDSEKAVAFRIKLVEASKAQEAMLRMFEAAAAVGRAGSLGPESDRTARQR